MARVIHNFWLTLATDCIIVWSGSKKDILETGRAWDWQIKYKSDKCQKKQTHIKMQRLTTYLLILIADVCYATKSRQKSEMSVLHSVFVPLPCLVTILDNNREGCTYCANTLMFQQSALPWFQLGMDINICIWSHPSPIGPSPWISVDEHQRGLRELDVWEGTSKEGIREWPSIGIRLK